MKKILLPLSLVVGLVFTGCDSSSNTNQAQTQKNVKQEVIKSNIKLSKLTSPLALTGSEVEKVTNNKYVLIFDDSGSMDGTDSQGNVKLTGAKKAVKVFFDSLNPEDDLFLITLNSGLAKGQKDSKKLIEMLSASGGTPLVPALEKGLQVIDAEIDKNKGYGNYTIISITDGESDRDTSAIISKIFAYNKSDVILKTIGFNMPKNNPLNSELVDYYSADDSEGLKKVLLSIKAESESFSDTQTSFEN